jgi:nitric oxide reductase subunit B
MHASRKLWTWLAVICVLSFAVLGWVGTEIYLSAPPIPHQVTSRHGEVLFSEGQVERGQQAWLSAGGQQLGSVWGHGSYLAPDWSADWLHREVLALREIYAIKAHGKPFDQLGFEQQAALNERLKRELRANTWDARSGIITLSPERAQAMRDVAAHYSALFGADPKLDALREQYAMSSGSLANPDDLRALPPLSSSRRGRPPPTVRAKQRSATPATGRTNRWSATAPPPAPASGRSPA